ncbi:MAG: hypothetical protein ACJAXN_001917 [Psychromonas sp.]|jgi:hypothetical protein
MGNWQKAKIMITTTVDTLAIPKNVTINIWNSQQDVVTFSIGSVSF